MLPASCNVLTAKLPHSALTFVRYRHYATAYFSSQVELTRVPRVDHIPQENHETMSTAPMGEASTTDGCLVNVLFDYPGADVVLRSQDSHHIQVPKTYIVNSSAILGELIREALDSPSNANAAVFLPVVQLPESGEILHCLLTFIFPVTPRIPPSIDKVIELLSVAQKYQMGTALAHIRASVAQLLPTRLEPASVFMPLHRSTGFDRKRCKLRELYPNTR